MTTNQQPKAAKEFYSDSYGVISEADKESLTHSFLDMIEFAINYSHQLQEASQERSRILGLLDKEADEWTASVGRNDPETKVTPVDVLLMVKSSFNKLKTKIEQG